MEEIEKNSFSADQSINDNGVFEFAPGITAQEMKSMFFDSDALVEPSYKLWQLNNSGNRYYYRYDENGEPEFFPSVTTVLSNTLRQSPFLIEWIAKKGVDEAERYKTERAFYGTFMHAIFEKLLIDRVFDLDSLNYQLKEYIELHRLPSDFIYHADELKKDLLSFAQFVFDYDVRPYAIEIALVHPFHRYAGMIDLPCSMLENPSGKTRINAINDFKSGKKGFYEDHEIQIHMYRDMWNVNFETHQIDRVFNLSPTDWRGSKPTYKLKDQTKSVNARKIPYLLELAQIEDEKRGDKFTSVFGSICLDETKDLSLNIKTLTLSELIKTRNQEKPDDIAGISEDEINQGNNNVDKEPDKLHGEPKKRQRISNGTNIPSSKKEALKSTENDFNVDSLLDSEIDI